MFDDFQVLTDTEDIFGRRAITMENQAVVRFRSYPFKVGQKIYIEDGHRHGDWEVIGVTDRKVTFRCPVSHREFSWDRFCYFLEERVETDPIPMP
jgi:hypothetical protein